MDPSLRSESTSKIYELHCKSLSKKKFARITMKFEPGMHLYRSVAYQCQTPIEVTSPGVVEGLLLLLLLLLLKSII